MTDMSLFACDLAKFLRERSVEKRLSPFKPVSVDIDERYPRVIKHLRRLAVLPAFSGYLKDYISHVA